VIDRKHETIFQLKRKAAATLYPDFDGNESDYQPIVDMFGDIALQVQEKVIKVAPMFFTKKDPITVDWTLGGVPAQGVMPCKAAVH
jgi:hypothetical protein